MDLITYFVFLIIGVAISILGIYLVNQNKFGNINSYDKEVIITMFRVGFACSFVPVINIAVFIIYILAILIFACIKITARLAKIGYDEEIEKNRKRY